jgi:hypothetical protein
MPEFLKDPIAFALLLVAMEGHGRKAAAAQLAAQVVRIALRLNEDDGFERRCSRTAGLTEILQEGKEPYSLAAHGGQGENTS